MRPCLKREFKWSQAVYSVHSVNKLMYKMKFDSVNQALSSSTYFFQECSLTKSTISFIPWTQFLLLCWFYWCLKILHLQHVMYQQLMSHMCLLFLSVMYQQLVSYMCLLFLRLIWLPFTRGKVCWRKQWILNCIIFLLFALFVGFH